MSYQRTLNMDNNNTSHMSLIAIGSLVLAILSYNLIVVLMMPALSNIPPNMLLVESMSPIWLGLLAVPAIIFGHLARGDIKLNPEIKGIKIANTGLAIAYIKLLFIAFTFFIAPAGHYFTYLSNLPIH